MYKRIKLLREQFNITQQAIAHDLNISVSSYILYESGKRKIPIHILEKLATKYQTSIDYIIGDTDCFMPHPKL